MVVLIGYTDKREGANARKLLTGMECSWREVRRRGSCRQCRFCTMYVLCESQGERERGVVWFVALGCCDETSWQQQQQQAAY